MPIFSRIPGYSKSYNFLKFSSLPKTFNRKPIGVITKKNINTKNNYIMIAYYINLLIIEIICLIQIKLFF